MGRAEIGHWSCSAWSVDVRVNPLDPPCGARFGARKLELADVEGRLGCRGVVGKPASIGDGVSHRGELMAASFAQKRGRCRKPARSISARPCPLIEAIAAVTAMSAAHALTTAVPGRIDAQSLKTLKPARPRSGAKERIACGQSLSASSYGNRWTRGQSYAGLGRNTFLCARSRTGGLKCLERLR
jgi:hypothetical protein